MDRGAWQATVHRVTQSQTQLKQLSMLACTWPSRQAKGPVPGTILFTTELVKRNLKWSGWGTIKFTSPVTDFSGWSQFLVENLQEESWNKLICYCIWSWDCEWFPLIFFHYHSSRSPQWAMVSAPTNVQNLPSCLRCLGTWLPSFTVPYHGSTRRCPSGFPECQA